MRERRARNTILLTNATTQFAKQQSTAMLLEPLRSARRYLLQWAQPWLPDQIAKRRLKLRCAKRIQNLKKTIVL
ncbi:hypothetical protein DBR12_21080 [Acidovorax sp. HMWF029]|nr:hypothetical protein DBR12_21080 [Acidovorax sp. HMWF029]